MVLLSFRQPSPVRFAVGMLVCFCVLRPALPVYGQTDRVSELISQLKDPDSTKRYLAAKGLADTKDPRAVKPLIAALKDRDSFVRYCAASALGEIKDPRAVEPLTAALKDSDSYVRSGAAKAPDDIKNARAAEPPSAAPNGEDSGVQAVGCLTRGASGQGLMLINAKHPKGVEVTSHEDLSAHMGHMVTLAGSWGAYPTGAAGTIDVGANGKLKMTGWTQVFTATKLIHIGSACSSGGTLKKGPEKSPAAPPN